jgi:choline dehydrogenase-like flavoprotein
VSEPNEPTAPMAPPPNQMLVAPTAPSVGNNTARVRPAADVATSDLSCEVLVIGTGAGGAAAGTELAKAGKKVLFLEAGGAYFKKHFQSRKLTWTLRHVYQNKGLQLALGKTPILLVAGRCVGGSTVLNSGIAFKPPKERLEEYARLTGDDAWSPEAMAPFVDEIWTRVGVFPTPPNIGRRNNALLQLGLERLGFPNAPMDRNAPGCVGCGVCHMGCPSGGKASVDRSLLPEAINHGAEILTHCEVRSLLMEGGAAKGAIAEIRDPETDELIREVTVRADRVLVAGSAVRSPLLLMEAGLGGPEVGKHLAIHPGVGAFGDFEEPVQMWNGVPQGYYGHDPEQPSVTFETANMGPGEVHTLLGGPGVQGADRALGYKHLACGGSMLRDDGIGTVSGDPRAPSIRYNLSDRDVAELRRATKTLVRLYFAAGARQVAPFVHPLRFYDNEAEALEAIDRVKVSTDFARVHGSHPHGTCRMGPETGESRGVCGPDGHVWGAKELYVVDGSVFPTTLGVNPQISIMAFALQIARRMHA